MNRFENLTVTALRLPRLAAAMLLLSAAACGGDDDPKSTDEAESVADTAGTASDAGKTTSPSASDAGTGATDGGSPSSSDAGASSAPDAATGGATVDVSEARITKVLQDFCTAEFTCDPEGALDSYTDTDTCMVEQRSYIDDDLVTSGAACASAELDFNTCYAATPCDTDPEVVCEEQFFQMLKVCS